MTQRADGHYLPQVRKKQTDLSRRISFHASYRFSSARTTASDTPQHFIRAWGLTFDG